jgi:hypothetical protein
MVGEQMSEQYIGIDISLNHLGMCLVDNAGIFRDYAFLTDTKKFVTADPEKGILYRAPSARNDHPNHIRRIDRFLQFVTETIEHWSDFFDGSQSVSIEGYALASKNTRLYESAELTGAIKRSIAKMGGRCIRIHDPDTLKLFAVGYGHASKEQMYQQFSKEAGVSIPTTLLKEGKGKVLSGPGTDVADAYFLARMLWLEHDLRSGDVRLQDLPPHLHKIYTRETKTYPVNLLERPLIGFEDLEDSDA